jgi:transposase-like protein
VWKCRDCRKQFSVLTGTVFHGSKVPLRTWLFVVFEMCANKNGIAAREIERKYGVAPKTAWFMAHRLREAMRIDPGGRPFVGIVVSDETWIGGEPANRHAHRRTPDGRQGHTEKTPVVSLISTGTGEVRSKVVPNVTSKTLSKVMADNIIPEGTVLHTDSAASYGRVTRHFAGHATVNHTAGEYVRDGVSTNKAENYFSQLKRSLDGTHPRISQEHLPRYLAEFDFRYTTCKINDTDRMSVLMGRTGGRRLSYRPLTGR